ncbi:MAG: hypothetical protein V1742_04595, partial [Pseudomonadota bacterium]
SISHEDNPFYQRDDVLSWIFDGLDYWERLQHRDGSFDQVFPNEHSFGATSYTLLAMIDTSNILGEKLPRPYRDRLLACAQRAGNFLLKEDETYAFIGNHLALFAVTFHEMWRLTGREAFRRKGEIYIERLLQSQSKEGWFPEYDGADPGYSTQGLYYLTRLARQGYRMLEQAVENLLLNFLVYFVHPDGSLGGTYGSRNTAIVYPAGLALLSAGYPQAAAMLQCLCDGYAFGVSPLPKDLDLPNAVRLAGNFLAGWSALTEENFTPAKDPWPLPWTSDYVWKVFDQAGIVAAGTKSYYCLVGLHKGGVVCCYDKASRKLAFEDQGYMAKLDGREVTTQVLWKPEIDLGQGTVRVSQPFFFVKLQAMSLWKHLALVCMGLTVFRWRTARELFKKLMVRLLITGKTPSAARVERTVQFASQQVVLEDRLVPPPGKRLLKLKGRLRFSSIHMASADYYRPPSFHRDSVEISEVTDKGAAVSCVLSFPITADNSPSIETIQPDKTGSE